MKILVCFLLIQIGSFSQTSFTIEGIPKIIFANYKGDGVIPSGFTLKTINPSFSFGFIINKKIYKNFHLCTGVAFNVNNYYSRYYRDFDSDKKSPYNRNLMQSSSFEPKLLIAINDIKICNKNNFFFEFGTGYSISTSPMYTINTNLKGENAFGIIDTVKFTTTLMPINNSKFKILLGFGKTFSIRKSNFNIGFGCSLRLSQNEGIIFKEIIDNGKYYKFDYKRNSSYIGINIRLTYKYRKPSSID